MRFVHVSEPLNWSAVTTKYHRDNWTFFKIRYIYTKGRNLAFKIVYSTALGGSQRNTETENRKFRFGQPSGRHNQSCDTLLTYTALFKDGARKHKRRIERRIFYEQDLFGWIWLFMRATNSTRRKVCACDCTRQTKRPGKTKVMIFRNFWRENSW